MNALLVLLYLALCVLLFLICRVPINRWTAPTATLGGILLTAAPIVAMDHYHPYSSTARPQVIVLPIVAPIAGTVVKVAVEENQTVHRGELLFNVDPEPLRLEVQALEARVAQARSSLENASAGASRDLAQSRLSELQAQLANALYRLGQTSVRAPAAGRIVDLGIVMGQTLVPAQTAMRVVDVDPARVVARLRRNQLARIEPGAPAEIAFDSLPGRVFEAEVVRVAALTGTSANDARPGATVQLRITDPRFDPTAPVDTAQAAIFGTRMPEAALLRKVLLRMSAWVDFVFPVG